MPKYDFNRVTLNYKKPISIGMRNQHIFESVIYTFMKLTNLRTVIIILLAFHMVSCVSNKKIAYVQPEDKNKQEFASFDAKFTPTHDSIILEENDVISVTINHLQLSRSDVFTGLDADANARLGVRHPFLIGFPIDNEGNVDIPTMGKTKVGGLTVIQAQELLRTKATQYYPNPSVKVFLMSNFVTVLGEVNNPGRYPVYNQGITVFDALGMASDMTDLADRNDVRIIRRRAWSNELYHINLNDDDILASKHLYMQPDDVILVTPLKAKKYIRRDPQNVLSVIGTAISLGTLYILLTK